MIIATAARVDGAMKCMLGSGSNMPRDGLWQEEALDLLGAATGKPLGFGRNTDCLKRLLTSCADLVQVL